METRTADGAGAAEIATPSAENRVINRIPVRLAVSRTGRSAPLGRTRDISLHGLFIETREPFPAGTVLPLSIDLGAGRQVKGQAEVVRVTADGMGLRFHRFDKENSRLLRRWIVDHTSVAGSRRQVEQLYEAQSHIEPIRDPARVLQVLADIRDSEAVVTLVPASRVARDYARVVGVDERAASGPLSFRSEEASALSPGEDIYALVTIRFVSYAFELTVDRVDGHLVKCALPTLVVFSERRNRERRPAVPGSTVRWPSPIEGAPERSFPLIDVSDDGFSFRVPHDALITPGTCLEGAALWADNRPQPLPFAEVRNIQRLGDEPDAPLRVGVSIAGAARAGRVRAVDAKGPRPSRVGRLLSRFKAAVSVVLNRGRESLGAVTAANTRRVVVRPTGLPIVGILDRTSEHEERLRAPLVIVIPGFAGRKEQLSFLSGILMDGFKRQNADIAVLRIDTTNNLGESGKDPGFERDGLHCMHHTVSGLVDDTLSTLAWARNNPFVDPTHIILVSMSLSSIGVRHVMTRPEAADVSLWFSYMGAADAIDTIRNASGNIDFHAYYMRGDKVGYISVNGVLTDGDHFWSDLHAGGHGYLERAKEEMAKINADVVWLRGAWDAFVDPRRVEAIMSVPAEGRREIIDVNGGHLPRTSEEAISQFIGVTRRIWQHVHKAPMPAFSPSIGKLALKNDSEWKAVRREGIKNRADWWRDYLLDQEGFGFDIVEYAPEYREFMEGQADLLVGSSGEGLRVLELGAGTGNLTRRLIERGSHVVATDLVPEALATIEQKVKCEDGRLQTRVLDLDGSALLACRRFLAGDLAGLDAYADRIPGIQPEPLSELKTHDGDELRAVLRGFEIDPAAFGAERRMSPKAVALLKDCHALARFVSGVAPRDATHLAVLPMTILDGNAGIPFPDASFDAVGLSLVLSYLSHPEDCLFEIRRVLRPGGRLVLSSMIRDADSSLMYLELIGRLEATPPEAFVGVADPEARRHELKEAARRFADHAAELYRIEEEGLFRFYDGGELSEAVHRRGFHAAEVSHGFGAPPQAVIVSCLKR